MACTKRFATLWVLFPALFCSAFFILVSLALFNIDWKDRIIKTLTKTILTNKELLFNISNTSTINSIVAILPSIKYLSNAQENSNLNYITNTQLQTSFNISNPIMLQQNNNPIPIFNDSNSFNPLIFTITNNGFLPFTKNWIINLHLADMINYLVICTDDVCFNELKSWTSDNNYNISHKLRLLYIKSQDASYMTFGEKNYGLFVRQRSDIIHNLYLEFYNKYMFNNSDINAILYMDADTGIKHNFISILKEYLSYDITLQVDRGLPPAGSLHTLICSCYIFIPFNITHNENILWFFDKWKQRTKSVSKTETDQNALNRFLRSQKKINVGYLKSNQFPSGGFMNRHDWRRKHWNDIYAIHANFRRGIKRKIEFLIRYQNWYLNTEKYIQMYNLKINYTIF